MRNCICYMRVGTKEQAAEKKRVLCLIKTKGKSKRLINEQIEELRDYCRKNNYTVTGIIKSDNGGMTPPKVLELMVKRNAEALIVSDRYQISHEVYELIKFIIMVNDFKKKVISVCEDCEITYELDEKIKSVFEKVQNSIVFNSQLNKISNE